jgi:hypothetical protein
MDPLTMSVVVILGKYALDKGLELGREVGPKALEVAKEMFGLVLERIGKVRPETAAEFPKDPATYEKPMQSALDAEVSADPDFAAGLKELLAQYEQAAVEHGAVTGMAYRATLHGDGAIAQGPGAVAAGKGGIAVGRDVQGGIHVGKPAEDET